MAYPETLLPGAVARPAERVKTDLAALVFGSELVRAPAIVMALGIFLLFAGPFLLAKVLEPKTAALLLRVAAWLLAGFAAGVAYLFVVQLRKDPEVLWAYTSEHFALGTWVAGVNVLGRVMAPILPALGMALTIAGWLLLILFGRWLGGLVRRRGLGGRINGITFLTTVALQSAVVASVDLANGHRGFLQFLVGVNVLGVAVYAFWFYRVWVIPGVRAQIASWLPTNNITHGALSISVLAATVLATRMSGAPVWLPRAIVVAWVTAAALLVAALTVEATLIITRTAGLLSFRVSNYARNFTFGMFFACTYYGGAHLPGSLLERLAGNGLLLALAALAAVVNLWEVGRHVVVALRRAVPIGGARAA